MASSFSLFATLFFALLFSSQAHLITKVCSKASNTSLCTQILESDPRSSRADLRGLGQIVLEKSVAATKDVMNATKNVPTMDVCANLCASSISALNNCSNLLKRCGGGTKCKDDMGQKSADAANYINECKLNYIEGGVVPPEVPETLDRAEVVISIFPLIVESL